MGGYPPPPAPRGQFSPDGLWWWDGSQWRPAISPDGAWRWDGHGWVPAAQVRPAGGGSTAAVVAIGIFAGVVVLVVLLTLVILYTMGSQISNVFSNVAAALGSSPTP